LSDGDRASLHRVSIKWKVMTGIHGVYFSLRRIRVKLETLSLSFHTPRTLYLALAVTSSKNLRRLGNQQNSGRPTPYLVSKPRKVMTLYYLY